MFVGAGFTIGLIGRIGRIGVEGKDGSDGVRQVRRVPWPVNYRTHPGLVYQAVLLN